MKHKNPQKFVLKRVAELEQDMDEVNHIVVISSDEEEENLNAQPKRRRRSTNNGLPPKKRKTNRVHSDTSSPATSPNKVSWEEEFGQNDKK